MWMPGRFVMGGFALFIICTLVRARRSGRIYDSVYWCFDVEEQPVMYTLAFGSHLRRGNLCRERGGI